MSTLLDSSSSPSSLIEDGQDYYDRHLKSELEAQHCGEFVAIQPWDARYFLGQTATAALTAARKALPESRFFLTRVGQSTAHKILSKRAGASPPSQPGDYPVDLQLLG